VSDLHLPSAIRRDFARAFGDAQTIVLHSASRALGYVPGGIDSVVDAVLAALGPARTLLWPTFTAQLTDPSQWAKLPAPPRERWDEIREELPDFDPLRTTPRRMGRLNELLLHRPGVVRSAHPAESVAAIGPRAEWLVRPHPLDDPMGPRSPWARLCELDARVVLVGVGFERCSIVHHGERLADPPYLPVCAYSTFVTVDGERRWFEVESGAGCSEGFGAIEGPLRAQSAIDDLRIGAAAARVVSARAVVRVAQEMLARDAMSLLCSGEACASCKLAKAAVLGHGSGGQA
jgi:aminoglycoside 3-N-acetyltransferase